MLRWLLYVLIVLSFAGRESYAQQDRSPSIEELRRGIVRVGVDTSSTEKSSYVWVATGFFVDSLCTVATAKHVIDSLGTDKLGIRVPLPDSARRALLLPVRVTHLYDQKDIALVRVNRRNRRNCTSQAQHQFVLSDPQRLESLMGSDVFIIGHPQIASTSTDFPIYRRGTIASAELENFGEPIILLDLIARPGYSGSPVILRGTRTVIGVMSGRFITIRGQAKENRENGFSVASPMTVEDYLPSVEWDVSSTRR